MHIFTIVIVYTAHAHVNTFLDDAVYIAAAAQHGVFSDRMSEVESGQETEDGTGSTTTVGEEGKQCTVYNLMADTQQCIRIFRAASVG